MAVSALALQPGHNHALCFFVPITDSVTAGVRTSHLPRSPDMRARVAWAYFVFSMTFHSGTWSLYLLPSPPTKSLPYLSRHQKWRPFDPTLIGYDGLIVAGYKTSDCSCPALPHSPLYFPSKAPLLSFMPPLPALLPAK